MLYDDEKPNSRLAAALTMKVMTNTCFVLTTAMIEETRKAETARPMLTELLKKAI